MVALLAIDFIIIGYFKFYLLLLCIILLLFEIIITQHNLLINNIVKIYIYI